MPVVGQMFGHIAFFLLGAMHQQSGAGLDQHAWWNAIDRTQLFGGHAHLFGDIFGLHGARRQPSGPRRQAGARARLQVVFKHGGVVPRQQDLGGTRRQNHRAVHGRVEGLEVFQADVGQFGGHLHIDVFVDRDALEKRVVLNQWQDGFKGLRLGNDVFHRLQFGYIKPRFVRHAQIAVGQGLALGPVACQCTAYTAFTPVVSRQGQVPIAEHVVELLQVVQRSAGGFQHIPALVSEQILFEVEVFARRRHELPHACGFGSRDGLRVEGRLNEGEQRQLGGHFAAL